MRARNDTKQFSKFALQLKLFSEVCSHFNISQIDCRIIIFIGLKTVKFKHLKHFSMHYKLNSILRRGYIIKPYDHQKQVRCSDKGIEVYQYFITEMDHINKLISTQDEGNKIDLIQLNTCLIQSIFKIYYHFFPLIFNRLN